MQQWKEVKFKNFIELQRGFDLPTNDFVEGEYPVVGSTSILGYHNKYKNKGEGVVTGRSGSLGVVQYIKSDFWAHNTALFVKDFKGNHKKFVYYFLQTLKLEHFNSGAGVPTLNRNDLENLKLTLPPLPTQTRIAAILSAYDDLIENNLRRIQLLEQTAQQLYKEWFVRLRFPNYENTPFENGLPKGWEVRKIGDSFEILGGGTPDTENRSYWENGTINWFSPTDITNGQGIFLESSKNQITQSGLKNSSARLFPPLCVMMTSRATIGEVGINTTQACTNQGFIVCIPNQNIAYPFIYFWIKQNKDFIISLSTGATFGEMTKSTFKKLQILLPNQEVMDNFDKIIIPLFNQIKNLQAQNQSLRQTRDRLLPRLMSGALVV
ncbi:MAG: restriction endonuclease subunit S [Thermoflexibacter sp.]|jgi:type I restriction enzyme S subunit|nr:restriction endonuclease subunit S [Thermoflexibacter sp.]